MARRLASRIPAWVWLAALGVVSAAVRIALARRVVAPWIMSDELIYSELAKSFAAQGHFLLRGVPAGGYGVVYPVLIAPAWRVFARVPDAYAAAKAIGAVVMSLAAVPAFFLARRVLGAAAPALVVAALTVLVPSMLFTGMLMTENVFYPLFLVVALALVAMLERPTPGRQVVLVLLCGLAYLTRPEAIALVPAVASAPAVLALVERRGLRKVVRPFATLYGILAAGFVLWLLETVARGRSVYALLGAYRAATTQTYTAGGVLRYLLYHAAELDLYLGVVPFAALLALWLAPRALSPQARVFAAASLSLVFWLLVEVAAFASVNSHRVEERSIFYVAPLALIALVGLAVDGVAPRSRKALIPAGLIAAAAPFVLPYPRFITSGAVSDTFALLPWWSLEDHGVGAGDIRWVALAVAAAAVAVLVALPRRQAWLFAVLVGVYFVGTSVIVESGRHGIRHASVDALRAGIGAARPDWIDRAVGRGADVDIVFSGAASPYAIWENEFFNRSIRRVYSLDPLDVDSLPRTQVARLANGDLSAGGKTVQADYVLADGAADIKGRTVAENAQAGLRLFRIDGPVVILTSISGLYPNDTWSGAHAAYQRVDCSGGSLTVTLATDPALYRVDQVVTAHVAGKIVGTARIAPTAKTELTVPLRPGAHGRCDVLFSVRTTRVPHLVDPAARPIDDRALGVHFLGFAYRAG